MSLMISEGATSSYTPCPAGSYPARCIQLLDLGTQISDFEGQQKSARKLLIGFEILDPEARRDDGAPFIVSKRFTASLHEKAALRKFLEAWRGRPFTPEELRGFDLQKLLGQTCLLGIVHATREGRTYANLSSVMRLPKGMAAPAGELEPMSFDLSAPDWQVFAALPSRLQDQIAASPEYASATPPARIVPALQAPAPTPAPAPEAVPAGSGFDDLDNDIPF